MKNISKITITVNISDEEKEFIIVFYDEIVIYIMDTDGESFLDGEWIEE